MKIDLESDGLVLKMPSVEEMTKLRQLALREHRRLGQQVTHMMEAYLKVNPQLMPIETHTEAEDDETKQPA